MVKSDSYRDETVVFLGMFVGNGRKTRKPIKGQIMKYFLTLTILLLANLTYGQATSQTDTLPSGELMLKQEIVINTSVEKVWDAYTTPEGWKSWVTPIVEMDFKINGTIKSHYDSTATIGDKGTIVNHILNYIPYKQITMQAELNENFPIFMIGEEKNLYNIVDFDKLSDHQTKLTIYGIGYKNEQQWIDLLKFFIQGNEMSLNKLKNYLEQF